MNTTIPKDAVACIRVAGVGGGGVKAVAHLIYHQVEGAEFICVDTDQVTLVRYAPQYNLQLGLSGLSANVKESRRLAEDSIGQIRKTIDGSRVLIVVTALGSGAGSGIAPVIARAAYDMGILTVAVVTTPFDHETGVRHQAANDAIADMKRYVSQLIVMSLQDMVYDDSVSEDRVYVKTYDKIKEIVSVLIKGINVVGRVNIKLEQLHTLIADSGMVKVDVAAASGQNHPNIATEWTMSSTSLGD